MRIVDLSIKRAVTFSMIFIVVLVFGFVSLSKLSPELFPDVTFPVASVIISYQGVGPEDMEKLIARPIEETVSTVTGVKEVSSTCKEGVAVVLVRFNWGTDMDVASSDIRERLDIVGTYLPKDATDPLIFKFDVSMQPIMFIGVSSDVLTPAEIRKLSEDKIEPILERVDGVAQASTLGGEKREIQVQIDRHKMEAYGLSINHVINVIRGENITTPAGEVREDKYTYLLRTLGEFTSVDQIKDVVLSYQDGAPVYIRDIASVYDTVGEKKQEVRVGGKPAVVLYVQKQSGANTVRVIDRANKALEEVKPLLDGKVDLAIIFDQSSFIRQSLNSVTSAAIQGGILAILVLFFFLHNIRSVVIISVAIPMSIIATFLAMYFGGVTLNMLSMGGLALGIGMLVDNAIVVLENTFRHRQEGEDRRKAASTGASEVGMAITASTLTTVAVFLPIVFVPGIAGLLFRDQALTVTFSLTCSLLVALTLVPLLCSRFFRLETERRKKTWTYDLSCKLGLCVEKLDEFYQRVLNWALDRRKTVILTAVAVFIASIAIIWPLRLVGTEFTPTMDQGEVILNMETPPGTSLDVTKQVVSQVEQIAQEEAKAELRTIYTNIGSGEGFSALFSSAGSNSASVSLELKDVGERDRSQQEVERAVKDKLVKVPGMKSLFGQDPGAEIMGFGGTPIAIEIYGEDLNTARQLADKIKSMVEKVDGTADVQSSVAETRPELRIDLDRARAAALGLNVANIASTMESNVLGTVATKFREGGDEYDVLVRLQEADRRTKDEVYNIPIMSPMMNQVTLRNVASIEPVDGPITIERKKQERMVMVTANLKGRDLGSVTRDIRAGLKSILIPQGFTVVIGGSAKEQRESFRWLGLALIGAIFLVYAVMACLYESLLEPFIIMFTFPLAIVGVIWMFFFTGTIFNIIAFVGVIVLTGIVVNNAIVMIDYINRLCGKGMELREAVVLGARRRLRPILMTSLTTIFALIPLSLGLGSGAETQYPLARAIVGGLTTSTILTLVIIPVVYIVFANFRVRRAARRAAKAAVVQQM